MQLLEKTDSSQSSHLVPLPERDLPESRCRKGLIGRKQTRGISVGLYSNSCFHVRARRVKGFQVVRSCLWFTAPRPSVRPSVCACVCPR